MKLFCMSDTHGKHNEADIPDGDVLIHAGDFSGHGHKAEVLDFIGWFAQHPHEHKVLIAGNHDKLLSSGNRQRPPILKKMNNAGIQYLEDNGVTIDGAYFYGSPWTPTFGDWWFMKDDEQLQSHWEAVPDDTDVLITHGPSHGTLDTAWKPAEVRLNMPEDSTKAELKESVGSKTLSDELDRIDPEVHIFGHIHEAQGHTRRDGRSSINAAVVNRGLTVDSEPEVVEL